MYSHFRGSAVTVQQMTKDARTWPLPTTVRISSDHNQSSFRYPPVLLLRYTLFYSHSSPINRRPPIIVHLTYSSHPSAYCLADYGGTDTSTNRVHTSSLGPHYIYYLVHTNVAEHVGHVLVSPLTLVLNASSLSCARCSQRCASIGGYFLGSTVSQKLH